MPANPPSVSHNVRKDTDEESVETECLNALLNKGKSKRYQYIELMLVNHMKDNKISDDVAALNKKALIENLQLEVSVDVNNLKSHCEDIKILQEQILWKEKILCEELQVVRNDTAQYEQYINNQNYNDFSNDTWQFLINLGRDELQNRRIKLQEMRNDLNIQYKVLHHRLRICHLLLWSLNSEEVKRKQRLQMLPLCQKVKNFSLIVMDELESLKNTKSVLEKLEHSRSSPIHIENREPSILNKEKLGCTFDFLLRHRVNRGGSISEYDDMVKIFQKKFPMFESVVKDAKTNILFEEIFSNQISRLERENEVYFLKKLSPDSDYEASNVNYHNYFMHQYPEGNVVHTQLNADFWDSLRMIMSSCQNQQKEVSNDEQLEPKQNQTEHAEVRNEPSCEREDSVQNSTKTIIHTETEEHKQLERIISVPHSHSAQDSSSEGKQCADKKEGQDSVQIGKKTINHTRTERHKKQLERNIPVPPSNSAQDISSGRKQCADKKEGALNSQQNGSRSIDGKDLKEKKKSGQNRYGLRSDLEYETDFRPELRCGSESDTEIQASSDNVIKEGCMHSGGDKFIKKNETDTKKSSSSEENGAVKLPLKKNEKKKSIKKLESRLNMLETLSQNTVLELGEIKLSYDKSLDAFIGFMKFVKENNCEFGLGTKTSKSRCECEQMQEKRYELLKCLNTLYTFLKRNDAYRSLIEEKESSLERSEKTLSLVEIETLVLSAVRDLEILSLPELKQIETQVIIITLI